MERRLNGNSCFSELTSNFPFFSNGSTWASLDIAASLFGTPSPSISSKISTVSHFPKLQAGNMSDLMLSPKYTTCRVRRKTEKVTETTTCLVSTATQKFKCRAKVARKAEFFSQQQSKSDGICLTAPTPWGKLDQTRRVCKAHHKLTDHRHLFCPLSSGRKSKPRQAFTFQK